MTRVDDLNKGERTTERKKLIHVAHKHTHAQVATYFTDSRFIVRMVKYSVITPDSQMIK